MVNREKGIWRAMIVRGFLIWATMFQIGLTGVAAPAGTPPALPCKSPTELIKALDYALNNQDTNFFLKLHYSKAVPAGGESRRALTVAIHFKHPWELTKTYSGFQLLPAPGDANIPRPRNPRTNQVQRVPNLPVVGLISYRTRGTSAMGLSPKPTAFSAGGDLEYGKAPDGTYWLTVAIPVEARRRALESVGPESAARQPMDTPIVAPPKQVAAAPVSLDPAITNDPQKTLQAYFRAIAKADREMASQLTARFLKLDDADIVDRIETDIDVYRIRKSAPQIIGSKVMENCAVVVILESPTDPDPAYLVKRKEGWRVLPGLTQFEIFGFDESDLKRFDALKAWYRSQVGKR